MGNIRGEIDTKLNYYQLEEYFLYFKEIKNSAQFNTYCHNCKFNNLLKNP